MITNERQYRIAKTQVKKFDEAVAAQAGRDRSPDVSARIHAAMGDALESEADELRRQLREYERLREGRVKGRTLRSLRDLPHTLIEARIAAHMTQKALASRLGVAEQQVQRWEASGYAGVGVERVQEVVDALGVEVVEKVSFARPPGKRGAKAGARKPRAGRSAKR